jgi:hypothetical protein
MAAKASGQTRAVKARFPGFIEPALATLQNAPIRPLYLGFGGRGPWGASD